MAMLACRQYTAARNVELGNEFGVAAATVSTAVRRTQASMLQHEGRQRDYERFSEALKKKSQAAI